MIELPANDPRLLALQSQKAVFTLLLTIDFDTGTERWSCGGPPVELGGNTFTRQKRLVSATTPDEKGTLGRDRYGLEFSDSRSVMLNKFKIGTPILVQIAFKADDDTYHPELFTVFKGRCITADRDVDEAEGPITVVTFAGPLSWNDSYRAMYMTDADQRQRDKDDDAFKYIELNRTNKWGGRVN